MRQAEFEQHVGFGNICTSISEALDRAKAVSQNLLTPA
jgi:hypothetical protein